MFIDSFKIWVADCFNRCLAWSFRHVCSFVWWVCNFSALRDISRFSLPFSLFPDILAVISLRVYGPPILCGNINQMVPFLHMRSQYTKADTMALVSIMKNTTESTQYWGPSLIMVRMSGSMPLIRTRGFLLLMRKYNMKLHTISIDKSSDFRVMMMMMMMMMILGLRCYMLSWSI